MLCEKRAAQGSLTGSDYTVFRLQVVTNGSKALILNPIAALIIMVMSTMIGVLEHFFVKRLPKPPAACVEHATERPSFKPVPALLSFGADFANLFRESCNREMDGHGNGLNVSITIYSGNQV